ncbi:MAG: hypothetical protein AAFX40_03810 [Cyanobacteria bacterium J06639_1]
MNAAFTSLGVTSALGSSPVAGTYDPYGTVAIASVEMSVQHETVLVASLLPSQAASIRGAIATQPILAQQYDQDVMGDIAKGWNNFVESGQVWACLVGAILGYLLRSITS